MEQNEFSKGTLKLGEFVTQRMKETEIIIEEFGLTEPQARSYAEIVLAAFISCAKSVKNPINSKTIGEISETLAMGCSSDYEPQYKNVARSLVECIITLLSVSGLSYKDKEKNRTCVFPMMLCMYSTKDFDDMISCEIHKHTFKVCELLCEYSPEEIELKWDFDWTSLAHYTNNANVINFKPIKRKGVYMLAKKR